MLTLSSPCWIIKLIILNLPFFSIHYRHHCVCRKPEGTSQSFWCWQSVMEFICMYIMHKAGCLLLARSASASYIKSKWIYNLDNCFIEAPGKLWYNSWVDDIIINKGKKGAKNQIIMQYCTIDDVSVCVTSRMSEPSSVFNSCYFERDKELCSMYEFTR